MKRFIILISCIIICAAAGGIGAAATLPQIATWYQGIQKPSFNPPNDLFGPVWSVLYLLMAIALFLYITRDTFRPKLTGYIWFFIQLILNAMWSVVFFGYHQLSAAFAVILLLLLFIVLTIIYFFRITKPGSILLVPYVLWVSFAAVLNFSIMRLNP